MPMATQTPVQWWDDYDADWRLTTARRTVTEFDILSFATLAGMNEALFMDAEYIANDTPFAVSQFGAIIHFHVTRGAELWRTN